MQNVTFKDTDQLQNVVDNPFYRKTTLIEWLSNNDRDNSGRHLRYIDYLSEYKWDTSSKVWLRRASDKPPAIGRLIYIHPSCGETFFLLNGEVCSTFRAACEKLGLLGDDVEWSAAFEEASTWAKTAELRALFTQMLLFCDITDPLKMWNEQWHRMADDGQQNYGIVNDDDLKQYVLYELELLLRSGSPSKSLTECGLPLPRADLLQQLENSLLMEERIYDRHMLSVEHQEARSKLNPQQNRIYEDVMSGISSATQRPNITVSEQNLISAFSSWLVSIGDGDIELIHFIYDNDTLQNPDATTLSRKAIICPTNNMVHEINSMVIDIAAGTTRTYTSIDSIVPHPGDNTDIEVLYPVEYFNLLNFNGLPTHVLELKVNSPVVLLRNLNPKDGLCNGTRLIVTQLLPAIVEAQIMTGKFIGRKGQSLDKIGIYLPQPVFSHGQLYVALSRATTPHSLKIVIVPHGDDDAALTKNIVYSDFLKEIDSTTN
ncbi:uncharacterized protein LOC143585838 [Bidens hawaiensis]|uniref:uncharacterized protein LOC143585838 n=1 Tax=Bidens hawaiensis TaxID=980011 RepID=UPI00404A0B83